MQFCNYLLRWSRFSVLWFGKDFAYFFWLWLIFCNPMSVFFWTLDIEAFLSARNRNCPLFSEPNCAWIIAWMIYCLIHTIKHHYRTIPVLCGPTTSTAADDSRVYVLVGVGEGGGWDWVPHEISWCRSDEILLQWEALAVKFLSKRCKRERSGIVRPTIMQFPSAEKKLFQICAETLQPLYN